MLRAPARPLLAALLVLALAPAALAMGERPSGTPAEQAASGAISASEMAKRGELEPALAQLLRLAQPTLDAYPIDANAACAIAKAQRQCVHEAYRHSDKGRWLSIASRANAHATETYRRLTASLSRQSREANGRRAGADAWFTVSYEALEAGIDQFPEIPLQDPSYTFQQQSGGFNPGQLEAERAMPRTRYKKDVLLMFKALRNNIQTADETKAFQKSYRRAVDAVRAANPTTLRLNELLIETTGWVDSLPAIPPR